MAAAIVRKIRDYVTCSVTNFVPEIIFFFFKIGESMLDPSMRLYIYYETCNIKYNATICDNLSAYPATESDVQQNTANYLMYYKILTTLPAIILGLFCGAWSDRNGRKFPVMLTSFGTILAVIFFMISIVMTEMVPFLVFMLIGAAIRGCFGKSAIMTMALHSYVADISSKEERTQRLGRLLSMNYFGYFLGSLAGGAMLEVTSFDVVFCAVALMNGVCVVVAMVFMDESVPLDRFQGESGDKMAVSSQRFPFHLQNIKDSISVLTRPRGERRRCYLICFLLTITLYQLVKSGEADITLLYVEHAPLNWRKSMYGYLMATNYACLGVAVMVFLPLLIHFLHVDDFLLVIFGLFFRILRLLILSSSDHTWMVFFAVVIGCPTAIVVSGTKSLISKSVDEDEMGKVFSILSCGELFSSLLGSIIFISIYSATFDSTFPGFAFTIGAAIHLVLFAMMTSLMRRNASKVEDEHEQSATVTAHASIIHGHIPIAYGTIVQNPATAKGEVDDQVTSVPFTPSSSKSLLGSDDDGLDADDESGDKTDTPVDVRPKKYSIIKEESED